MKIKKAGFAAALCLLTPFLAAGCGSGAEEIVWEQTESGQSKETEAEDTETADTVVSDYAEESENLMESSAKNSAENGNAAESKETSDPVTEQTSEAGDTQKHAESGRKSEDSQEYIGAVGTSIPEGQIYVDICGAVVHPGVYRLPEGARLYQAVEMAGGLTEEADLTVLNQASPLTDGMKIQVYTREEVLAMEGSGGTASAEGTGNDVSMGNGIGDGGAARAGDGSADSGTGVEVSSGSASGGASGSTGDSSSASDGKVNLNTADKETLKTLTGIGDVKAQLIIDWRTEHGGFSSIEEIMQISGIKEGTFNKIKDEIVVE